MVPALPLPSSSSTRAGGEVAPRRVLHMLPSTESEQQDYECPMLQEPETDTEDIPNPPKKAKLYKKPSMHAVELAVAEQA
eukprot:4003624-Alexandrium_andersonii.AAC.1